MYYLYEIENTITKQKYYGITSTSVERRWKQHLYSCKSPSKRNDSPKLYNSIRKYGEENFTHSTLLESEDGKYIEEMEVKYISEGENLLNISPGGGGMCEGDKWKHSPETIEKLRNKPGGFTGRKHSEETKKKMSLKRKGTDLHKGENNGMYGKTFSDEWKKERSKLMRENNPMKGKKHSEETRRKISETRKKRGITPWNKGLKLK